MAKYAYVFCTGCPESRIDTARVQQFLKENDWNIISDVHRADLILFRACGLTEYFEKWALNIIKQIKSEKKEHTHFIVWGCLPKINKDALGREYEGITFGETDAEILNEIIKAQKPFQDINANYLLPPTQIASSQMIDGKIYGRPTLSQYVQNLLDERFSVVKPESFPIKVSTGCLGNCAFCAVRLSRESIQSKAIHKVVEEFKKGLDNGFKYFSLLATDLGSYGRDQGVTLVDLVKEVMKEPGDFSIGLRNVNPYHLIELFDELQPIFASDKIWFLSTSVESGSNKILKSMRRRYTIEEFKKYLTLINVKYPQIILRTQIMVGFPGETEQDFQDSLDLLDEVSFDWVEVYKYSNRPGTLAALMEDQVPDHIKVERYNKLLDKSLLKIKDPLTTKNKLATLIKHPSKASKAFIQFLYNSLMNE